MRMRSRTSRCGRRRRVLGNRAGHTIREGRRAPSGFEVGRQVHLLLVFEHQVQVADLFGKRISVLRTQTHGAALVSALYPARALYGDETRLRSLTSGRGRERWRAAVTAVRALTASKVDTTCVMPSSWTRDHCHRHAYKEPGRQHLACRAVQTARTRTHSCNRTRLTVHGPFPRPSNYFDRHQEQFHRSPRGPTRRRNSSADTAAGPGGGRTLRTCDNSEYAEHAGAVRRRVKAAAARLHACSMQTRFIQLILSPPGCRKRAAAASLSPSTDAGMGVPAHLGAASAFPCFVELLQRPEPDLTVEPEQRTHGMSHWLQATPLRRPRGRRLRRPRVALRLPVRNLAGCARYPSA